MHRCRPRAKPLPKESELHAIRDKILTGKASRTEAMDFMRYVVSLEGLVQAACDEGFYGIEGWRHLLKIED
jgi:hypothetical protein